MAPSLQSALTETDRLPPEAFKKDETLMKSILTMSLMILFGSFAQAHIGWGDDYECFSTQEKDCWVKGNSQKVARLYFRGTPSELGNNCSLQTQKIGQQIYAAEQLLGLKRGDLKYSAPNVSFEGANGVVQNLFCSYAVWSERKDLRFDMRNQGTINWTDAEEKVGACMENVRAAEAIPGSIGAGRGFSASLLQGEMCSSLYLMPGLDRIGKDLNGNPTIIKFGTREYTRPEQNNDTPASTY